MSLAYKNYPIRKCCETQKCRSDPFNCVESCVSDQTSWVTINDVVPQNAGRRLHVESKVGGLHYRGLGRGLPLTLPNVRQVNGRDQRLRPRS